MVSLERLCHRDEPSIDCAAIVSGLQENVKTYGDRAPGLLSGTKLRDYPLQPEIVTDHQANSADSSSSSMRYVTVVPCVFLPGPFYVWHSLHDTVATASCRNAFQLPSLTEQALHAAGAEGLQYSVTRSNTFGTSTASGLAQQELHTDTCPSNLKAAPSWLTPQQLQNRHLGEWGWLCVPLLLAWSAWCQSTHRQKTFLLGCLQG